MATALLFSTAVALTVKASGHRYGMIYGKQGGKCTALCSPDVNAVCAMESDDGVYYVNLNCATRFAGVNYAIPTR